MKPAPKRCHPSASSTRGSARVTWVSGTRRQASTRSSSAAVADTMPPLPITVTKGQVLRVEPRVGQLRLHWNGSNDVSWYLLDHTGEKTLSPEASQCLGLRSGQGLRAGSWSRQLPGQSGRGRLPTGEGDHRAVPHYRRHHSVGPCASSLLIQAAEEGTQRRRYPRTSVIARTSSRISRRRDRSARRSKASDRGACRDSCGGAGLGQARRFSNDDLRYL